MYSKLIHCKEILMKYINEAQLSEIDSIDYLVDTMDYLILGKIPCDYEILNIIMSDVMVCNSYHKNNYLLKVVSILNELCEELLLCTK